MKGILKQVNRYWNVFYKENCKCSFSVIECKNCEKHLPVSPEENKRLRLTYYEGFEIDVEFEIVEELEDWGAIKATLQKVQYAKLIQPKEEVSEEAKQRTKNLYTPSHKKYIEKEETKITKVEVIDEKGRSYTNYNVKELELSYQDEGRTLKLFIK